MSPQVADRTLKCHKRFLHNLCMELGKTVPLGARVAVEGPLWVVSRIIPTVVDLDLCERRTDPLRQRR